MTLDLGWKPKTYEPLDTFEADKPWELPKQWSEQAMTKVGEGISRVPILPEAFKFVAPAFEWIHRELEVPFAAVITSPFSPDLPWKKGESWLAHQKREYNAWEAPTYVKGLSEFAMPLWWMPWFAWAGAGAKALGIGSKTATALAKSGKVLSLAEKGLPSTKLLDTALFKSNISGGIIRAAEKVPVINRVVERIGGMKTFANPAAKDPLNVTRRALVKKGYIEDMRSGVKSLLLPKLQVMGKQANILGMDARGIVSNIVDKSGKSQYLYDVLEGAIKDPDNYRFLTRDSRKYVKTLDEILNQIYTVARNEGVRVPKKQILHRLVKGKMHPKTGVYEKSEFGSYFEVTRSYELMKEGVKVGGIDYGLNIDESVSSTINHYMKAIANKRFEKDISHLGRTPNEMWKVTPEGIELANLRAEGVEGILKNEARIRELSDARARFMKHYSGQQILGENLAKFHHHPVFKKSLFPKEVVKTSEKYLYDEGQKWLESMATVSGTSRMLTAALDFSAPFIQGLGMLGRNPLAWAKGVKKMFGFASDPNGYYRYLTDPAVNATRMERILAGGSSSTFEFYKAMKPLQRTIGKIPGAGKVAEKFFGETWGRAETAFTGFGEVARNEMWKALRRPNMSPEQFMDLSRTIDRMTGVMSTEALGIGRTQQDFENAFLFFAPRYTRAGLTFVGDAFRGGMAGAEARKALGSMMGGGLAMYYGACKALGQEPNLDPNSGRFLTLKVGDSHVGIGGIMVAMMRLAYDVGATAYEDPANLVNPISEGSLNRWDNPFIRFLYARTAPLTSLTVGTAIEQADYFGEPFESVADWGKFMADKVTPIALQGVMEDPNPAVAVAEFSGLREFPKSPWELLDEERDSIALRDYGQPYENLNDLEQTRVDKYGTVKKLRQDVDAQTVTRGDEMSVGFINRQREKDTARQVYEETLQNYQRAYDNGVMDAYTFREKMSEAGYGLGVTYEHIDSQYPEVVKALKKPRKLQDKHIEDIAYDEFVTRLYEQNEFEDEYGIFRYDEYNKFIEYFRAKYGEEIYQYILDRKAERDQNLPPLAQEYQGAKEVLKPYWEVTAMVERMLGKTFASGRAGQRMIQKLKAAKRMENPEIDRYIKLFYTREMY